MGVKERIYINYVSLIAQKYKLSNDRVSGTCRWIQREAEEGEEESKKHTRTSSPYFMSASLLCLICIK